MVKEELMRHKTWQITAELITAIVTLYLALTLTNSYLVGVTVAIISYGLYFKFIRKYLR